MPEPVTTDTDEHDHDEHDTDIGAQSDLYVYVGKVRTLLVRGDGHGYAEMTDGTARFVHVISTLHDPDTGKHALLVSEGNLTP